MNAISTLAIEDPKGVEDEDNEEAKDEEEVETTVRAPSDNLSTIDAMSKDRQERKIPRIRNTNQGAFPLYLVRLSKTAKHSEMQLQTLMLVFSCGAQMQDLMALLQGSIVGCSGEVRDLGNDHIWEIGMRHTAGQGEE